MHMHEHTKITRLPTHEQEEQKNINPQLNMRSKQCESWSVELAGVASCLNNGVLVRKVSDLQTHTQPILCQHAVY